MANHTASILVAKGKSDDLKRMQAAVKGEEQALSCDAIRPMPKELEGLRSPALVVSPEDYKRALDEKQVGGLPITKEMQVELLKKYGCDDWYEWAMANWGSKWDVYEVGEWKRCKGGAKIYFESADSPVVHAIVVLSRQFPDLTFTLKYADEGGGFLGSVTIARGETIGRHSLEWSSEEGVELRKELGYYDENEDEEKDKPQDKE